ncbi:hypothetical protein FA13DRAFT_1174675 [Coprinellus micaceus]|uniref:Nephrocystin 3-like N-terminal domain-containing protein n=1 Tax=Coprinellus micaceus TaxID=71717 RepID=A0A4Y7STR0_COPMI|nr:hypothetical protein FA13DRAFT_1174675 [Coprinellus micaceus]
MEQARSRGAIREGDLEAPGDEAQESAGVTYNIYHGPINHIGQSHNANLGVNYGSFQQSQDHGLPPTILAEVRSHDLLPRPFPIPSIDLFSLLNPILDASHTRNLKFSPPNSRCFPGTRKAVIEMVFSWAGSRPGPTSPHIMWIHGYAGCGKSAIAQEVSNRLSEQNRLAASFFFCRGSQDRSRVTRFAGTIVSQIASIMPSTLPIIEAAVRGNPGLLSIGTTSLSSQFEHLVYRPTLSLRQGPPSNSTHKYPFIIVLDGLDECEDSEEITTFIEDMVAFFDRHPLTPLQFLITSRVGEHIHRELHSSAQVNLLNLVQHTSDEDILAALDASFAREKRSRILASDGTWPDASVKKQMVRHIGGSFIFMATILRALFDQSDQDGLTPMERLPLLLRTRPAFDGLYKEILSGCQHLPYFVDITSLISRGYREFSTSELAELLQTRTANVVLVKLHAVMHVPDDDHTPITLWHASLRDFLCCRTSAGPFFTNHKALVVGSFSLLVTQPDQSSVYEYCQCFAMDHLAAFVEESENDPDSPSRVLSQIALHLSKPLFDWSGPNRRSALEVASRSQSWKLVCALADAGVELNAEFHGESMT